MTTCGAPQICKRVEGELPHWRAAAITAAKNVKIELQLRQQLLSVCLQPASLRVLIQIRRSMFLGQHVCSRMYRVEVNIAHWLVTLGDQPKVVELSYVGHRVDETMSSLCLHAYVHVSAVV
jgi:hypothetical protein